MENVNEEVQRVFLNSDEESEVIKFNRVASARHLKLNELLRENFSNLMDNQ